MADGGISLRGLNVGGGVTLQRGFVAHSDF